MSFYARYPASSAAPVGGATSANQVIEIGLLTTIAADSLPPGQATMANSSPVVIASDQSAIAVTGPLTDAQLRATPVPISGSISATNPSVSATGAAVPASATFVGGSDGTNLRALKVSATGVLSVDGSASTQPVSGTVAVSNFPATQPVSGTVAVTQSTSPWVVSGSVTANAGTNLNTSALALDASVSGILRAQGSTTSGETGPLIQGAVTTAAPSYTTAQTNPLSLTTSGSLRVDGSGSTQPVSGTVTINALTNSSVVKAQLQDNSGTAITLGQKTMASSVPVVIASDQSAIPISGTVTTTNAVYKEKYRLDFSTSNVTTSAYVQIAASTSNTITQVEIYSQSYETLVFATGAAASEVDKFYIMPGGNQNYISISIASGTRLSIKGVSGSSTTGYINFNLYG